MSQSTGKSQRQQRPRKRPFHLQAAARLNSAYVASQANGRKRASFGLWVPFPPVAKGSKPDPLSQRGMLHDRYLYSSAAPLKELFKNWLLQVCTVLCSCTGGIPAKSLNRCSWTLQAAAVHHAYRNLARSSPQPHSTNVGGVCRLPLYTSRAPGFQLRGSIHAFQVQPTPNRCGSTQCWGQAAWQPRGAAP